MLELQHSQLPSAQYICMRDLELMQSFLTGKLRCRRPSAASFNANQLLSQSWPTQHSVVCESDVLMDTFAGNNQATEDCV